MAACAECRALKKRVRVLERQLQEVEAARDGLILELEREQEGAWELLGDVRVSMVELERPRDFDMPLLGYRKGGAA